MSTNHNRIKVSDLETNDPDKILITNQNGELEFNDVNNIKVDSYNALDYTQEGKALDARQGKVLKDLIDNIKDTLKNYFDTLYIGISNDQNISGIKTFFAGKLGLRNVANTFTSFFTNSNTTSRTYTLQNRDGVLLDNTDLSTINSSLATKQSVFTGVTNHIAKSLNSTTLGSSRLIDNGNSFGIGTVNIPTKDISLGYQNDREIGIEQSDNTTIGRNLRITAGKTINYVPDQNFIALNQPNRNYNGCTVDLNGDVYVAAYIGDVFKQTGGVGPFVSLGYGVHTGWQAMTCAPNGDIFLLQEIASIHKKAFGSNTFSVYETGIISPNWRCITVAPNGDIYAGTINGDIYIQSGGSGNFIGLGQIPRNWTGMCSAKNGDIYACVPNGDIYKRSAGSGDFVGLNQTSRLWKGMTSSPNGDIYATVNNGDIYKQTNGLGNFIGLGQTYRRYYGISVAPNGNIYTVVEGGDIYCQQNNSTGSANLKGGNLDLVAGTGKGNAESRLRFLTGQKTVSGTDMQIEIVRAYIDENGHMVWTNMPTYPDNNSAILGGLPIGCEYKTATGDRKIVY